MICPECNGSGGIVQTVYFAEDANSASVKMERHICPACNGKGYRPMTNADRIRALTDGELAATLIRYDDGCGMWFGPGGMYENREDAPSNALDWLKKPVEVMADG